MFAARLDKQVVVEVFNDTGVLYDLSKLVAEKGVNILAVDADVHGENSVVRMVTDDNLRAADALRAHDYHPVEETVVLAELKNTPGMLEKVTGILGKAQITIKHLAVTSLINQGKCLVVLACSDNGHAVVVLNG